MNAKWRKNYSSALKATSAPNGHYHISTMKMNVQGKALSIGFGQEIDMRISDLTPLP